MQYCFQRAQRPVLEQRIGYQQAEHHPHRKDHGDHREAGWL